MTSSTLSVDERRVLDDIGTPKRDPEEQPQRGHGVIWNGIGVGMPP
jgi:hypothetical protein